MKKLAHPATKSNTGSSVYNKSTLGSPKSPTTTNGSKAAPSPTHNTGTSIHVGTDDKSAMKSLKK